MSRTITFARRARLPLALAVFLLCTALAPTQAARRKVIVDQDTFGPGGSNIQSILMLLQAPDVEVLGITVESGDGWQDENVAHVLRMLELIHRTDVPVFRGSVYPLVNSMASTKRWEEMHGKLAYKGAWMEQWPSYNSVDRTPYHEPGVIPPMPEGAPAHKPSDEVAANFLVREVREFPGQITIFALGPVTNLALAERLDEHFAANAKELVCMCGSFNPRAAKDDEFAMQFMFTPRRNFNDMWDPEAAQIVRRAGWKKITMVPTDATTGTKLTAAIQASATASNSLLTQYVAKFPSLNYPMWDELTVAVWLDPSLVDRSAVLATDIDVDPDGAGYGDTLSWRAGAGPGLGEPDANVIFSVNVRAFEDLYVKLIGSPPANP
jgi:inosine-uridine nucleoside N-ribohydrolase